MYHRVNRSSFHDGQRKLWRLLRQFHRLDRQLCHVGFPVCSSLSSPIHKGQTRRRRRWLACSATAVSTWSNSKAINDNNKQAKCDKRDIFVGSSSKALRDHWVSVWQRDKLIVYLYGSTHGSPHCIQLVETLVRDVAPQLVFVELDSFSISLLLRYVQHQLYHWTVMQTSLGQYSSHVKRKDPFEYNPFIMTLWIPNKTDSMFQRIFGKASTVPTNFTLETRRLKPITVRSGGGSNGDKPDPDFFDCEFFHAAWEGHVHGAWGIVLGNRSDFITRIRYVWYHISSRFRYAFHAWTIRNKTPQWLEEAERLDREDKRDGMRRIMEILQQGATVYHRVFVEERDVYLGAGVDTAMTQLQRRLEHEKQQQREQGQPSPTAEPSCSMVAIVGKGHIFGVEQYLKRHGWKQVELGHKNL